MKRYLYLTILLLTSSLGTLPAQHRLESGLNLPRPGDEIIKQQVRYKDPGRSGEQVIWDFSRLEAINDAYTLVYSAPYPTEDSLCILAKDTFRVQELATNEFLFTGTEHRTIYYYHYLDSCLWTLGYENAATFLHYDTPLLTGIFPSGYNDKYSSDYTTSGLYSMTVPFKETGNVSFEADAYGMMLLPSGDTLNRVLRTQTVQFHAEPLLTITGDRVSLNTCFETYKWYSQGYRYPVFETLRTVVYKDSTEIDRFETAFFYPPQDHYYLESDEANLSVLDSLDNESIDPWAGLRYNFFPNPAYYTLSVELYLPKQAHVRIQLRNTLGMIVLNEDKGTYPAGICNFQCNTSTLPIDNYILNIWLDDHLINTVIMKR